MSSYTEDVKRVLSEFNRFLKITLLSESLSSNAETERKNILKLLQKLFSDYDSLAPSSGDEGSVSSYKDVTSGSLDESRNTIDSSHGSEEDNYSDNIPDATVKALAEPAKIGYLDRRHEYLITSAWQKRYCVLHKNIFYIFKKPDNKKQQGAFFVTGYEFRDAPQLVKEERKKDWCFELVCPGKKSYQFLCNSKEDMLSWKEALLAASSSSNQPVKDDDIDGDIYEDFKEDAVQNVANVKDDADELYNDTEVDTTSRKQQNAAVTKQSPAIPKVGLISPPAVEIKKTHTAEELDDDLIYEPIDAVDSTSPSSKPTTFFSRINQSTITSASSPPSLPPHSPKFPQASLPSPKELDFPPPPPPLRVPEPQPPPIPPQRGHELPPPPPQEAIQTPRALPPPPTDPLPALPQTPKKMTIPNLGKILHPSEDYENLFYGKWDCTGTTGNELTFKRGQIVHVISRDLEKDDWWVGALDDKVGLVPRNYLSPAYEQIR